VSPHGQLYGGPKLPKSKIDTKLRKKGVYMRINSKNYLDIE